MLQRIFNKLDTKIPGINGLFIFVQGISTFPSLMYQFYKFKSSRTNSKRFDLSLKKIRLCPFDSTDQTSFDAHYTYHPAWAARKLAEITPQKHTDIGSIIEFSTIVSSFIPTDFYDYRPSDIFLSGYRNQHANLLDLFFPDNSIESLSCMHTIEHIGLGRYGDPIDYDGDLRAIEELIRVLAPGGKLLFVVPMGQPRIEFNAHRVYSYEQILEYFSELKLSEFSLLPDDTSQGIITNANPEMVKGQKYACGMFEFIK